MDKSLLLLAVFVFMAGSGSATRLGRVKLEAPNDYVFSLSEINSSSFFNHNIPNSLGLIYTSAQFERATNKSVDTNKQGAMCPRPLAVLNSIGETFVNLYKQTGCCMCMDVRLEVQEDARPAEDGNIVTYKIIKCNYKKCPQLELIIVSQHYYYYQPSFPYNKEVIILVALLKIFGSIFLICVACEVVAFINSTRSTPTSSWFSRIGRPW